MVNNVEYSYVARKPVAEQQIITGNGLKMTATFGRQRLVLSWE